MLANYFEDFQVIKFIISIIDIILVWILVYTALNLLKGTRGIQLIKGILIILVLKVAFNIVGFKTMNYIIDQIVTWGVLAIIIIFQPEIRKTLEHIGRFDLFNVIFNNQKDENKEKDRIISLIANSANYMAERKIGALIALENINSIKEYTESGITLNSDISQELIINIFMPNSPLHDGAIFIKKDKIVAASCLLPLSESRDIASKYGTRHRAALGLSEITDAIVLSISEETGTISIAIGGKLITDFNEKELIKFLTTNWLVNKNTLRRKKYE